MHRFIALICCLMAFPSGALAAPVVVWLDARVPDEVSTKKAERLLDATARHLAHSDIAFPLDPFDGDDAAAYERVSEQLLEARTRWNEYEVELGIAANLASAVRQIEVIRDERDLRMIVDAHLVIGAAMAMAMTPEEFRSGSRAEPYRTTLGGVPLSRGWVQASALDPERVVVRADLVDGSRFEQYESFLATYGQLPEGSIDLSAAPSGAEVFVDGAPVPAGTAEIFARAGSHYVHFLRDGDCLGRSRVEVAPQKVAMLPAVVAPDALGEARQALLSGSTAFPDAVASALTPLAKEGPLYVATVEDGKVVLEPWAGGIAPSKAPAVTAVAVGEFGAAMVHTSLFEGSGGAIEDVPAASGSLGFEVGIYNLAIVAGSDVAITPGRVILYGNSDMTANEATGVLPMPYGGLGAYVLRPSGRNATLLLAGTYGWQGPAHWGLGGRLALGIPTGEVSWFRLSVAGTSAPRSQWDEALDAQIALQSLHVRIGLGAGL